MRSTPSPLRASTTADASFGGVVDIDTRSDVYSLGVLLYELLTGTPPFDKDTLQEASFDEMRRIIREEEPPKPSAMVSTLNAEAISTVSRRRRSDRRRLRDTLRGEIDWNSLLSPIHRPTLSAGYDGQTTERPAREHSDLRREATSALKSIV